MSGRTVRSLVALAAILALPATMRAQEPSWREVQAGDIETMKDKWVALAGAFDEADYDWRPMDDVRSVREVLGLALAEANLFPAFWGATSEPVTGEAFEDERDRAAALSQSAMIAELETSFDRLASVVRDMDRAQRLSRRPFFDGSQMEVHAIIAMTLGDMHEHLGQLIAYARTNHVVPPWSSD